MGRKAKLVPAETALQYVAGYTCVNDATGTEFKTVERPIISTRFKLLDTFCPLGPVVETDLDPQDLTIVCRVNGREVTRGNTRDICWTMGEMVAWVTTIMTLLPGDIICTGSPNTGPLEIGDIVEVEVSGIGILRNPVVAEPGPR